MEGLVERQSEIANIVASHIRRCDYYDDAAALANAELFANDGLSDTGLRGLGVVSCLRVDDNALDLENGWDAQREGY